MDFYLEIRGCGPERDRRTQKDEIIQAHRRTMDAITGDLTVFHPKTILLFGSMARYLKDPEHTDIPNDIDVIMVGNSPPFGLENRAYASNIELHLFKLDQMTRIARILRYDARPVALSRLYSRAVLKNHSRDVIAASLLLGPNYNAFGIEQIEGEDGITDKRDYSVHRVLYGETWWNCLTEYARERRGPVKRLSDKIIYRDQFDQWMRIYHPKV